MTENEFDEVTTMADALAKQDAEVEAAIAETLAAVEQLLRCALAARTVPLSVTRLAERRGFSFPDRLPHSMVGPNLESPRRFRSPARRATISCSLRHGEGRRRA